jgi:general secretion pathway protein F
MDGASATAVSGVLAQRGLVPIGIEARANLGRSERRVPRHALAASLRGLCGLIESGVPVSRALPLIARHAPRALAETFTEAERLLREGHLLSAALANGPAPLPRGVCALIAAGERQGRLGESIAQAAAQLEREADLMSRTRQALVYPAVLLATGAASLLVIVGVVIPRFAMVLHDLGQSLPTSTRLLLAAGHLLGRWWWLALLGCIAAAAGLGHLRSTREGRRRLDAWLLALPVVGPVRLELRTARICRALGTGIAAGLTLPAALAAGAEAGNDLHLGDRLARATQRVREGMRLGEALRSEAAISPVALDLVAVGEASGDLARMAARAADLAEDRGERALRATVSLVEPALVLAFGGAIGFVALALLQAVYAIRPVGP